MPQINEPYVKKSSCSYCGDAPVNHAFSFLESLIAFSLEVYLARPIRYSPRLLKDLANRIPIFLFETLALFKLAKFSSDISRANTFRSKIIWEEAQKRGIIMEQVIFFGKPLDHYRATTNNRKIYFESIPIRPEFLDMSQNWDDKVILKQEFEKHQIPIPAYFSLSLWSIWNLKNIEKIFSKLEKPIVVKPRVGSRGRHTITNINSLQHFREGISIAQQISSHLIAEEHLQGNVCRATLVNGVPYLATG